MPGRQVLLYMDGQIVHNETKMSFDIDREGKNTAFYFVLHFTYFYAAMHLYQRELAGTWWRRVGNVITYVYIGMHFGERKGERYWDT